MDDPLRLIIAASDPMVRAALAAQLAAWPGAIVIGQVGSPPGSDSEAWSDFGEADALIWDAGWEGSAEPAEGLPAGLPWVVLVSDPEDAMSAWTAGARAILTRDLNPERIILAARAAIAGLVVLAPEFSVVPLMPGASGPDAPADELTGREREVLSLLAEGLTNKAIAQRLAISDHTVKFHVNAILGKLGAQSRTEAVVRATRLGLLSL